MSLNNLFTVLKGGKGSGNFGHAGRPGKRGGSSSRGSGGSSLFQPSPPPQSESFADKLPLGKAPGPDIEVDKAGLDWLMSDIKGQLEQLKHGGLVSIDNSARIKYKIRIAKELSKLTDIPEDQMSDFVKQWASSSNDRNWASLLAQKIAGEEFGVGISDWQKGKWEEVDKERKVSLNSIKNNGYGSLFNNEVSAFEDRMGRVSGEHKYPSVEEATKASLKAMYDHTQAQLKEAGLKTVTVYRGLEAEEYRNLKPGEVVNVSGNAMESWSFNPKTANYFADREGVVLKMEVPIERVIGTSKTGYGCLPESEVVVLGGQNFGQARIMDTGEIDEWDWASR